MLGWFVIFFGEAQRQSRSIYLFKDCNKYKINKRFAWDTLYKLPAEEVVDVRGRVEVTMSRERESKEEGAEEKYVS